MITVAGILAMIAGVLGVIAMMPNVPEKPMLGVAVLLLSVAILVLRV